jgi:hypothetical protein
MGVGRFFNSVNKTIAEWGGTFYLGMFILTILMMVLLFSWLSLTDANNSLIIGTTVLLFIPAFVFLTLWMSAAYKFGPIGRVNNLLNGPNLDDEPRNETKKMDNLIEMYKSLSPRDQNIFRSQSENNSTGITNPDDL